MSLCILSNRFGYLSRKCRSASLKKFVRLQVCDVTPFLLQRRVMHLDRTKGMYRQDNFANATVSSINTISPSVKLLQLKVNQKDFSFHAGQWLDVIIPEVTIVGGFSICSDPISYKEDSTITLAVKESDHPPAKWFHTNCTVGAELSIRVGGGFYFDNQSNTKAKHLLLIAGGVGINPILSIASYVTKLYTQKTPQVPDRITMLYSAKKDELIFKDDIVSLCTVCPNLKAQFFITGIEPTANDGSSNNYQDGRITNEILHHHVLSESASTEEALCYICGPPDMINSMVETLKSFGLNEDQINFEKWW